LTIGLTETNQKGDGLAQSQQFESKKDEGSWDEYIKFCSVPPDILKWVGENLNDIRHSNPVVIPDNIRRLLADVQ